MNTEIGVSGGTPTGANTIELFNSFTAFMGTILAALDASRLIFSAEHDQALTLRLFKSNDGSQWDQVGGDVAMAIPAAGDIGGPHDFLIDPYRYVRLMAVNGGVDQGTWRPNLVMVTKDRSAAV